MNGSQKGFSLVEVIVVAAIMAVLVGVLTPVYLKYVEKSRISSDNKSFSEVARAMINAGSDEEIMDYIKEKGSVDVMVKDGEEIFCDYNRLQEEVRETVGKVDLQSKKYKNKTITLVATLNTPADAIIVTQTEYYKDQKSAAINFRY